MFINPKKDAVSSTTEQYNTLDDQDVRVRKYGEVVYNSISSVASFLEYPKGNCNLQAVKKKMLRKRPYSFVNAFPQI